MNYRDLKRFLDAMNEKELDQTCTIYDDVEDEYHSIQTAHFSKSENCDVLDEGHFFLTCKIPEDQVSDIQNS